MMESTHATHGALTLATAVRVIIPTYKAGGFFASISRGLINQGVRPEQVLVIDSSSADGTASQFESFGAQVLVIPQTEFNHGGTRRLAAEIAAPAELLIYLTQDAIPADPEAFSRLLSAFEDPEVGMAYGRQLPRPQAKAIERHAREKNYPPGGIEIRSFSDRERLGVKTTFCSNSFAAYRRSALDAVGSFPEDAFFAEDQITAGKILMAGWKLAYVGDACVTHSHGYSIGEEFRRYFDVGVFHARNQWLLWGFGKAEGEGLKFVASELAYLWRAEPSSIPAAIFRTFAKYAGYRLGRLERFSSESLKARLSMSPAYWKARIK